MAEKLSVVLGSYDKPLDLFGAYLVLTRALVEAKFSEESFDDAIRGSKVIYDLGHELIGKQDELSFALGITARKGVHRGFHTVSGRDHRVYKNMLRKMKSSGSREESEELYRKADYQTQLEWVRMAFAPYAISDEVAQQFLEDYLIRPFPYPAPTSARVTAHISASALRHNLEQLSSAAGGARVLMPVKANAYGHGATLVARAVEDHPLLWGFGVASSEEAWELLEAGISKPILLLTPTEPPEAARLARAGVRLSVGSSADLEGLPPDSALHLKVNTGMNRLGVRPEGFADLLAEIRSRGHALEGVYSHFASADAEDLSHARGQIEAFKHLASRFPLPASLWHLSNSAGIHAFGPEAAFDLIRPGISSYGYAPDARFRGALELRPALRLTARIGAFQTVLEGESVSYGGLWTAGRDTLAANVQMGYADGLPRGATGQARFRVAGEWRPVLGRICMDQCMVDVTGLTVALGDEVELFGPGEQTASEVASWVDTIDYEVLTRLERSRVARVLLEDAAPAADQGHTPARAADVH